MLTASIWKTLNPIHQAIRNLRKVVAGLATLCMLAGTLLMPAHKASAAQSDTLEPGMNLNADQSLISLNGYYRLQMQGDGNLVLVYAASGEPIWATGTDGTGAVRLSMQLDGNLVLYTARNVPVWASNTGSGRSILRVQGDRNVVIYQENGGPVWATNTTLPRQRALPFPILMKAGDCEMYQAVLFFNSDGVGEFSSSVLTNDSTPLWQTDVWHIRFEVKDRNGNILFKLPLPAGFVDTYWDGPNMKQHPANVDYSTPQGDYHFEKSFTFDAALFDRISTASSYSKC